ncbi:MAG: permease [Candidatus Margulisiibacteriota bacterium]
MFKWFADYVTYGLLRLAPGDHLADSLNFFLYDVPKIYFLLVIIVFFVALIRTYLPPERIRRILSHEKEFMGNITAAALGIFTPFCTCSAIPLFIGMLESGVPLGVTMSFLVASPTINEVALVMLWGLFGWRVAVIYVLSGMLIAIVSGFIIGRLKMEKEVEDFVFKVQARQERAEEKLSWQDRLAYAVEYVREIFLQVWFYVLLGVGVGAFIHGYVPVEFVTKYAGNGNPFAVIIAVVIGVPLYSNAAGTIPVVQALFDKGLALGTTLAFMMAVTGLSLPEFIILRKVLKPRLLLTYFGVVATGIVIIGYLFNLIF